MNGDYDLVLPARIENVLVVGRENHIRNSLQNITVYARSHIDFVYDGKRLQRWVFHGECDNGMSVSAVIGYGSVVKNYSLLKWSPSIGQRLPKDIYINYPPTSQNV